MSTLEGFYCITHLISRDEPGSVLVPAQESDRRPVYGGLFEDFVVVVVVGGDLPTPPTHGDDPPGGVPLHALHHSRAMDGGILNELALRE